MIPTRLPTEERQAEIVAAALVLARTSSPALITTGDIAAAVGVTQGAVFKHFPTKEAIWVAAMTWVREQLLQTLTRAGEAAESPLAALAALFKAHVAFVIEHPGVPRVIFQELQQPVDTAAKREVRALLHAYRQLLLGWLQAAVDRKALPADLDLNAAAMMLVGMVQGLVMQSMLTGQPAAMQGQADAVFALYLRGLGASA